MPASTLEVSVPDDHAGQVARHERFEFGRNWRHFLRVIDEPRIRRAEQALVSMLRQPSLANLSFLDIGCGSGLSSLAARRLGARVHSFDFDPDSAWCTEELRRRYFPGDAGWTVERGSVLDDSYMRSLGTFDIVYSWGVLHHTGHMWDAVAAASNAVAPDGKLFLALYNDLGSRSRRWRAIKHTYNALPRALRPWFVALAIAPQEFKNFVRPLVKGRPFEYLRSWTRYDERGMSRWRDAVDWVGGYPYEVATPEQVFDFCTARGFALTALKCGGVGLGCNEFVFDRKPIASEIRPSREKSFRGGA
jgi:2-polyprenyl-6-hydroxyphenyl methylase/3-demethylubiquinone-9 3-methyltransferase